jgi:hypothetical protein
VSVDPWGSPHRAMPATQEAHPVELEDPEEEDDEEHGGLREEPSDGALSTETPGKEKPSDPVAVAAALRKQVHRLMEWEVVLT